MKAGVRAKGSRRLRVLIGAALAAGVAAAVRQPGPDRTMGGYATSLRGRTRGQRRNAALAAQRLDGAVIPPGGVFSFERVVGPWTADRGYGVAPVSYEGEMIADWGGGVCQTSTTLYNAALIAGLEIVERHRHTWSPSYAPPGRDATVAPQEIDLKLRDPYPWPVRIRAHAEGGEVRCEVAGRESGPMATVREEVAGGAPPIEVVRADPRVRGWRVLNRGMPGLRVSVYRTRLQGPNAGRRELVSEDSYPPMNRVVAVGRGDG